ncbi:MAG: peptide ABC transporter substrate-binding protein [Chloroflexota bacterium]
MPQFNWRAVGFAIIALLVITGLVLSQALPALENQTAVPAPAEGVLRLAGSEPRTLDPALAQDATSSSYLVNIHEGLVKLDDKLQVAPALAASWQVSPDGRTYTFKLREDARFQDGQPVTASDVKYSLERATDPVLKSPVAATYLGDIVGVADKLAGRAKEVSGVTVRDGGSVAITIDAPKVYFLAKLTYPTANVLQRQNVESGPDWAKKPNGAGPYRLTRWDQDWLVLQRSEQYYAKAALPREVRFYVGNRSPLAMYEADQLDVTTVNLGDIERALDKVSALNKDLVITPGLGLYYLGLNATTEPFADRNVRRAFAQAIDKDKIVQVTLKGTVRRADGLLPPGLPGYDEGFKGLPYDLAAAKRSLADSAYGGAGGLPPVTITGGMGDTFAQIFYRNLGAEMEVQVVREGFFEGLLARAYQMFFSGWLADYPDPQNFLDVLLHSQSEGNHSGYANNEVDRLLEQARVEDDAAKRLALYRQVERIAVADAALIPLYFDAQYTLVKPRVHGLALTPLGIVSFEGASVN